MRETYLLLFQLTEMKIKINILFTEKHISNLPKNGIRTRILMKMLKTNSWKSIVPTNF